MTLFSIVAFAVAGAAIFGAYNLLRDALADIW